MKTLPFDKIESANGWVQIDWTLSNICNYSCEYCPAFCHDHSHPWPSLEAVDYTTKKLTSHYNGKKLDYILLGGELAIWKQFPDAIDIIKNNSPDCHIKLVTNGSMPQDYWNKTSELLTSIVFSYHPTQVKDIDKFINSVNSSKNKSKSILILAWPDVWEKVIKDREYIAEKVEDYVSLEFKIVDGRFQEYNSGKINYTQSQLDYINNNRKINKGGINLHKPSFTFLNNTKQQIVTGQLLVDGKNKFKDWYCGIGVDKLTLFSDGSIKRGSGCNVGNTDEFGNWKEMNISKLPNDGVICTVDRCWCLPDLIITKKLL